MGTQSVLLFVHVGGKDLFYDALRVITLRACGWKDLYYVAPRVTFCDLQPAVNRQPGYRREDS